MAGVIPVTEMAGQAQQAWDAMTSSIRQRAAYNALAKIYGPIAGDPVNALRMQAYGYNEQMNPLQIANQQITNQGRQQQQDYLAQEYPLKLQSDQEALTQDQQKTQAGAMSLAGQKALQVRGALGGVLSSLGENDPGDPNARGQAFDQAVTRSAQMIGADPTALAQELAGQRQQYITAGAKAVPTMQQQLEQITLGAMSPADRTLYLQRQQAIATATKRQQLMDAQTATQNARTGLVQAQTDAAKKKALGVAPGAGANGGVDFTDSRLKGVTGTIDTSNPNNIGFGDDGAVGRALHYLDQSSDSPMYRGLVEDAAKVPFLGRAAAGTPEYQLQQEIDQIAHNLPLDDYRTLKAMGGNLGRVTNTEFMALKDAVQNLNTARSKPDLRRALISIGTLYSKLQSDQAAGAPAAPTGQAPAAPAPAAAQPFPAAPAAPAGVDPTTTQSILQPGLNTPAGSPPVMPSGAASSPTPATAPAASSSSDQTPPVQASLVQRPNTTVTQGDLVQRDTPAYLAQRQAPATAAQPIAEPAQLRDIPGLPPPNIKQQAGSVPAAAIYQGLVQRGLSPALAYATLGNWKQESELKTSALNPGEGAIGFDQWRGGRADNLRAFAARQGKSVNDPNVQMDFYVHELKTGQGLSGRQAAAGRAAMAAGDIATANRYLKQYIAYGSPARQGGELTRLSNAMGYAKMQLGKEPVDAGQLLADASLRGSLDANGQSTGAAVPQGGGQNALLPAGSQEQAPSTAATYQPQTGPQASQAPQGQAQAGQDYQEGPVNADALSAPVSGPGAATPQGRQVDWESVLPYLPELLAMAKERRTTKRG